jgi:dolichyl-diphosphooligosaccharide--protein glycosyltransferase
MKGLLRQARILLSLIWLYAVYRAFRFIAKDAHTIRLHSIQTYGPTIHEFDPYFNLRATEYLYEHGWKKFATWFDYMSWYPLGRPVGTIIPYQILFIFFVFIFTSETFFVSHIV